MVRAAWKKRSIVWILILAMICQMIPAFGMAQTAGASQSADSQYVTFSMEGLTIGDGFYVLPTRLSRQEIVDLWKTKQGVTLDPRKLTVAQATYAFLENAGLSANYGGTGYRDPSFYLRGIYGIGTKIAQVPEALKQAYQERTGQELALEERADDDRDLGEFDFTEQSGWMITLDDSFISVGAGKSSLPQNGDCSIRWMFTVAMYGADLGSDFEEEPLIKAADRRELYELYAASEQYLAANPDVSKEVKEVMGRLDASQEEIDQAAEKIRDLYPKDVTLQMQDPVESLSLTDGQGENIDLGECTEDGYHLNLRKGTYRLTGYASDQTVLGSLDLTVGSKDEQTASVLAVTNIYETHEGWKRGVDYTAAVSVDGKDGTDRHATGGSTPGDPDRGAVLCYTGDTVNVRMDPLEPRSDEYTTKTVRQTMTESDDLSFAIALPRKVEQTVTAPEYVDMQVGTLTRCFVYTNVTPKKKETANGMTTWSYELAEGERYYYRAAVPEGRYAQDAVTYTNWFVAGQDQDAIRVTLENLHIGDADRDRDTVIRDYSANVYDVADLYMTVGAGGEMNLQKGQSKNVNVFRNWLPVESYMNAQAARPDFHYEVLDLQGKPCDDVIRIDQNHDNSGDVTVQGVSEGTALVLVTYDALTNEASGGQEGGKDPFFGAIWPENTGVFVVNVGQSDATIDTGLDLDSELDVLYYSQDEDGATCRFTPQSGVTVSVARPVVTDHESYAGFTTEGVETDKDGEVTVSGLVEGTNILRFEQGGRAVYRTVRAKQVTMTYEYQSATGASIKASQIKPGDKVIVTFGRDISGNTKKRCGGVYLPANKFSGVYNMSGAIQYRDSFGHVFTGESVQYDFSSNAKAQRIVITIPEDMDRFSYDLTGSVLESGYGSAFGSHRKVTYRKGRDADFTASRQSQNMACLPSIHIEIPGGSKTVHVKVTDYIAGGTGLTGASKTGLVLQEDVQAANVQEALESACNAAGVRLQIKDGSVVRIGSLESESGNTQSGWMMDLGGSPVTDLRGLSVAQGDFLNVAYTLNGGLDIAAANTGLPTLRQLEIGGQIFRFDRVADGDDWTYLVNQGALGGKGTSEDPFVIQVSLDASDVRASLDVSASTVADSHYVTVQGLRDSMGCEDEMQITLSTEDGRRSCYRVVTTRQKAAEPVTGPVITPIGTIPPQNASGGAVKYYVGKRITIKSSKNQYVITNIYGKHPEVSYLRNTNTSIRKIVIPKTIRYAGKTWRVTGIAKTAFQKNKKLARVEVKSIYLKKARINKKAFTGIKKSAVVRITKKKYKTYRSWFLKKGLKKKSKIKKL